jgi:hypothetical protein
LWSINFLLKTQTEYYFEKLRRNFSSFLYSYCFNGYLDPFRIASKIKMDFSLYIILSWCAAFLS